MESYYLTATGKAFLVSIDRGGATLKPISYNASQHEFVGNIGIGTTTPDCPLEVIGSAGSVIKINSTSAGAALNFEHSNVSIGHVGYDNGTTYFTALSGTDEMIIRSEKSLYIGTGGNNIAMTIDTSQEVGIGTTSPSQKLHVTTTTAYEGILVNGSGAPSVCFAASGGTTTEWKVGLSGNNSNNFAIGTTTTTDRVTIDAAGDLGIATGTPVYKCHVNGTFGCAPGASVTPVNNGDVIVEATGNTTLTFKLKGSDGTVRSGTVTLS